jgi:hypothetical protein
MLTLSGLLQLLLQLGLYLPLLLSLNFFLLFLLFSKGLTQLLKLTFQLLWSPLVTDCSLIQNQYLVALREVANLVSYQNHCLLLAEWPDALREYIFAYLGVNC